MTPTNDSAMQMRLIESQLQSVAAQRHSLQSDLLEVDAALEELQKATVAYKIVGSIMLQSDVAVLRAETARKKEAISAKMKQLDAQEKTLAETHASLT